MTPSEGIYSLVFFKKNMSLQSIKRPFQELRVACKSPSFFTSTWTNCQIRRTFLTRDRSNLNKPSDAEKKHTYWKYIYILYWYNPWWFQPIWENNRQTGSLPQVGLQNLFEISNWWYYLGKLEWYYPSKLSKYIKISRYFTNPNCFRFSHFWIQNSHTKTTTTRESVVWYTKGWTPPVNYTHLHPALWKIGSWEPSWLLGGSKCEFAGDEIYEVVWF